MKKKKKEFTIDDAVREDRQQKKVRDRKQKELAKHLKQVELWSDGRQGKKR